MSWKLFVQGDYHRWADSSSVAVIRYWPSDTQLEVSGVGSFSNVATVTEAETLANQIIDGDPDWIKAPNDPHWIRKSTLEDMDIRFIWNPGPNGSDDVFADGLWVLGTATTVQDAADLINGFLSSAVPTVPNVSA